MWEFVHSVQIENVVSSDTVYSESYTEHCPMCTDPYDMYESEAIFHNRVYQTYTIVILLLYNTHGTHN